MKLTYFSVRGRPEPVGTYILQLAGAEYDSKVITMEEWPAMKPSKCIVFLCILCIPTYFGHFRLVTWTYWKVSR